MKYLGKFWKFWIVLIILVSMFVATTKAQNRITIDIYQDIRLLTTKDSHGNSPVTIDIIIKSEWQSRQKQGGYWFAYPQYEYAELEGGLYERYSWGAGFAFNRLYKSLELSPSINWGILDRYGRSFFNFEAQGDISYRLSNKFRVSLLGTLTQRRDLDYAVGDMTAFTIRFNGYIGLKYLIK